MHYYAHASVSGSVSYAAWFLHSTAKVYLQEKFIKITSLCVVAKSTLIPHQKNTTEVEKLVNS